MKFLYRHRKERKLDFNDGQFRFACASGVKEIVEVFLEYAKEDHLDPNYSRSEQSYSSDYVTPWPFLEAVVSSMHANDPEIIELLFESGLPIDFNKVDRYKCNAFHYLIMGYHSDLMDNFKYTCIGDCSEMPIVDLFFKYSSKFNLKLNIQDIDGETTLHVAFRNRCLLKALALLSVAEEQNINVNARLDSIAHCIF